jgi:hypothetical protein
MSRRPNGCCRPAPRRDAIGGPREPEGSAIFWILARGKNGKSSVVKANGSGRDKTVNRKYSMEDAKIEELFEIVRQHETHIRTLQMLIEFASVI